MSSDDTNDFNREEFLSNIAAFEQAEFQPLFDVLLKAGFDLPEPQALDDSQTTAKLWETINVLSMLGVYLHNTNHLNDRELYTELWNDALREDAVVMPDNPDYAYHIDMIGSGSEEDIFLYLKYYADEDHRRDRAEMWPTDELPEREEPPFDRDSRLPQAESREDYPVM